MHHRTVMGQEQRARMRAKIVNAAMKVFAKTGPYAPVIEDFVKAAAIGHGTFYNYFDTIDALRAAAVEAVSDIHIAEVQQHFKDRNIANPLLRFATANRLYQRRADADPLFAGLLTSANRVGALMQQRGVADLQLALEQGLIEFHSAEAAFSMAVAISLYAARYPRNHRPACLRANALVRTILRAMRADDALINEALSFPLPRFKHNDPVATPVGRSPD